MKMVTESYLFLLVVAVGGVFGDMYAHRREREPPADPLPCKDLYGQRHFDCRDGTCILEPDFYNNPRECDSIIDCHNGEDENPDICRAAHLEKCIDLGLIDDDEMFYRNNFRCQSGMCIKKKYENDGLWDCYDKTDEESS